MGGLCGRSKGGDFFKAFGIGKDRRVIVKLQALPILCGGPLQVALLCQKSAFPAELQGLKDLAKKGR